MDELGKVPALNVGDKVRVIDADIYIAEKGKKVRDREGVIQSLATDGVAFVLFGKRNGRGKEFRDRIRLNNLTLI